MQTHMSYSARLVDCLAKREKGVHKTGLILDATFVCIHSFILYLQGHYSFLVPQQRWFTTCRSGSLSTNEQEPVRKKKSLALATEPFESICSLFTCYCQHRAVHITCCTECKCVAGKSGQSGGVHGLHTRLQLEDQPYICTWK